MIRTHLKTLALAALAALGAACTPESQARTVEAPATPHVATITALDFTYQAPKTLPAGMNTLRLVNQGPELHHVQLVRIDEGHTMQEFLDRVAAGEVAPAWVTYVGGPNTPVPDGKSVSEATLHLKPGSYALICFIPSRDGVPHLMKGMAVPLVVTPTEGASAAEPAADVQMKLTDYAYSTSSEIRAGRRTIRVENAAEQPHEVILVQLAPGKTVQDMLQWFSNEQGPPPGAPIAGTTLLSRGEVNFVTADFAPGEYALLCMVPDHKDGKPHIAHGMFRQITVR